MPPVPSKNFLTSKAGPFPVWGWGAGGLAAAYAYSRYKANKSAAAAAKSSTSTSAYVPGAGAVGQPATGAPTFLIENNLPPDAPVPSTPSTPVTQPTGGSTPPVTTPTGSSPQPPTNQPPPPPPQPAPTPLPVMAPPGVWHPPPQPPPAAPPPPPAPPPRQQVPAHTYRVQHGDTLSKIAAANNIPGGWQALWAYQLDPRNNPPQQIATLKARGPNLLFAGETIRIPAHY
jgi:LysM repeat protein